MSGGSSTSGPGNHQRSRGERLYGALCKLKDYEDTGCNPGDVEGFIELGGNLVKIVAEYVKKYRWIPVEEASGRR